MWSLRSPWPDPCSWSQREALTPVSSLRCHRCRLDALVPVDHQTPDGSTSFRPQTQLYSMRRREGSRPAKTMIHVHRPMFPRPTVPALYALWFRVRNNETVDATDGLLWRRPGAPAIGVAHTVLVGKSRPVVCRRRVGRLDALVL